MNNRRKMFDFAMKQMSGFTLEGSISGDNRTIFSLIEMLIRSASGNTLEECQKPLAAVLRLQVRTPKERFMGCKLNFLQQTIRALFGDAKNLLSGKSFGSYDRDDLLEYLEVCRRMFVSKYAVNVGINNIKAVEPKSETAMERAIRLAMESNKRKQ